MTVNGLKSSRMDRVTWIVVVILLTPVFTVAWESMRTNRREIRELLERRGAARRAVHYHSKRHMLTDFDQKINNKQRRSTTLKARDTRKKPSGHLTPLQEDDIDNDEVMSVAIGPPPSHPKYDKLQWKPTPRPITQDLTNQTATNLIKEVLTQLGRELITKHVSDDFIFGQFLGNSMKNLSANLKLKMQHEILEMIVKYHNLNRGETPKPALVNNETTTDSKTPMSVKEIVLDKKLMPTNETDDTWPDFSNLAKIVG